jgi:hypothetical protein
MSVTFITRVWRGSQIVAHYVNCECSESPGLSFEMFDNNKTTSSLHSILRLPAEIRMQIYTCVLTSPTPLSIYCWRRYTPFCFSTRVMQYPSAFLSLLLICRQIYSEARLLPFQCNVFRFKSQDAFIPWLDQLRPEQVRALRRVELVTWMARHMVEGESWVAKRVEDCFPIQRLEGLRNVRIEVRMNGREKDCIRAECWNCECSHLGVSKEEERLGLWFCENVAGVEIDFARVAA